MIGLYMEDKSLKANLKSIIEKEGYLVCDGYNSNATLVLAQGKNESEMDSLIKKDTDVILIINKSDNPYINSCYYSLLMPVCLSTLLQLIKEKDRIEKDYLYKVSKVLLDLGVSPMVKGYGYLKEAINLYINHRDYFLRDIYEVIGYKNETSAGNVERNIRYAIESAFDKCRLESQERLFKNSINPLKGKPTNMELICRVGDFIEIEG